MGSFNCRQKNYVTMKKSEIKFLNSLTVEKTTVFSQGNRLNSTPSQSLRQFIARSGSVNGREWARWLRKE